MTRYGLRRGRQWLCVPSPQKRGAILRTNHAINRANPPWADPAATWMPGLKLAAAPSAAGEHWDAWLTTSLEVACQRQKILAALPANADCMGGTYRIESIPVNP